MAGGRPEGQGGRMLPLEGLQGGGLRGLFCKDPLSNLKSKGNARLLLRFWGSWQEVAYHVIYFNIVPDKKTWRNQVLVRTIN